MSDTRAFEDKPESAGVQSVEVGMALIRPLLDFGAPLTLKAIAEAAGFAPPKAHRYLVSLIRCGLVERHRESGRYALGPLAVDMGFAALGLVDQDGWGREAVTDLALDTGVTACSVAWVNGKAVITAVELGFGVIFTGVRLGSHLSLLNSASGRVLLAYLPREATKAQLAEELPGTGWSQADIEKLITTTRTDGASSVTDIVMAGMSGLAVPVFDFSKRLIYTLTMLGQTGKHDFAPHGPLAQHAITKAADLSARLGYKR